MVFWPLLTDSAVFISTLYVVCPPLSNLQDCVSPCPKDCGINETERFNCLITASRTCTPGCECGTGFSLNNGNCIADYNCPGKCSRTSLVRTPGDRQNAFALSGIRINQYHLY